MTTAYKIRRPYASWLILLAVVLMAPPAAPAQSKSYKVGLVSNITSGSPASTLLMTAGLGIFRQELQRLGYVEGQNLSLQVRNDAETGVRDLLQTNVDVLVAVWSPAALAAKRATSSVPIVAVGPRDPVELGLVSSLARPGGNVTGISSTVGGGGVVIKRLEIVKELVPRNPRVAFLTDLAFPGTQPRVVEIEHAAPTLGLTVQTFDVRSESDLDKTFPDLARRGIGGVVVAAELLRTTRRIITLAAKHRLPVVYALRQSVEEGGLVAYDIDRRELFRRGAYFVDRILKGTTPSDLPFEQPTLFELVINMKTARALGLVVPPALLLRATDVIQ